MLINGRICDILYKYIYAQKAEIIIFLCSPEKKGI